MLIGRRSFLSDIACALGVPGVAAAYYDEQPERRQLQFFSGRVDECSDESITLSRHLASRKHEVRVFVRTPETIVSGELKTGVRAIVAYTITDSSYVAHRVIVRR